MKTKKSGIRIRVSKLDIDSYSIKKASNGFANIIEDNFISSAFKACSDINLDAYKIVILSDRLYFYDVEKHIYFLSNCVHFDSNLIERLALHDSKNFSSLKPFDMVFYINEADDKDVEFYPYKIKGCGQLVCLT